MKVGAANMPVEYEKERNLQWMLTAINEAKKQAVELLVFPEQVLQGYIRGANQRHDVPEFEYQYLEAEPIPGPSCDRVKRALEGTSMTVVFGLTERSRTLGGGLLFNSAVTLDAGGVKSVYRKVHSPADELHFYNAGVDWPVFRVGDATVGVCICYDLLFPESTRALILQGAQVIAFPTAWPDDLEFMYDAITRVRAVENQAYLVAANQIGGPPGSDPNHGHSRVVAPNGTVIAERVDEGLLVAEFDPVVGVQKARAGAWYSLNLIRDRKPGTYGILADTGLYTPPSLVGSSPPQAVR